MGVFSRLLFLLFFALNLNADVDFREENRIIQSMLNEGLEAFKSKDYEKARQLASEAYFQHFEYMEGAIGRNIGKKGFLMEKKFTNLRAMYGAALRGEVVKLSRVQALLEGLFFDLDEVVPIIQDGFRLKAEAADPNYDKEAAIKAALEVQKKAAQEAALMFGISVDEKGEASVEASTSVDMNASTDLDISSNTNLDALQAAASLNPKLQFLYDLLSDQIDLVIHLAKNKEYEKSADALKDFREKLYMHTKLEVTLNKIKNINARSKLRVLGLNIREAKTSEKELREFFEGFLDEVFTLMQEIPLSELSEIKVEGWQDNKALETDYSKLADDIKISTKKVLEIYIKEGSKSGIDALQNLYLDVFEASGMESKIGAIDSSLKLAIEAEFSKGVAFMKASKSKEDLSEVFAKLNTLIEGVLPRITDSSPWFLFIAALTIILREGMEALIIIVAMISYIIQSGNKNKLNIVYSAISTGVVLSFITAFLLSYIIKANAGQSRELIEGFTMLVAVLLLFYVGFWLLSNAHNKSYNKALQENVKQAISKGNAKALWWTVFLAVFREGAETILFYQALLFDASTSTGLFSVLGGLALGLVILIVLFFALKAGALRIPIKQFFMITSYIIFYMCFVFTGKGVVELIEGKLFTPHLISYHFEPILWLGLHPYYESLLPQLVILLILFFGILYTTKKGAKDEKSFIKS